MALAKWADTKIALDDAQAVVDDLNRKLLAAKIVLKSRKHDEFMAYCDVPENEREHVLPDDANRIIIRCLIGMGCNDLSVPALVCHAWKRAIPPPIGIIYNGHDLNLAGSTLLLRDRAVDVNTRAILATFTTSEIPSITPDGATLMLRNADGISWRSLREPPHHAPITMTMQRLLELFPAYSAKTYMRTLLPGFANTVFPVNGGSIRSGVLHKNVLINALNSTQTEVDVEIEEVDVAHSRIVGLYDDLSRGSRRVYRMFDGSRRDNEPIERVASTAPNFVDDVRVENGKLTIQICQSRDKSIVKTISNVFTQSTYISNYCIDSINSRVHVILHSRLVDSLQLVTFQDPIFSECELSANSNARRFWLEIFACGRCGISIKRSSTSFRSPT